MPNGLGETPPTPSPPTALLMVPKGPPAPGVAPNPAARAASAAAATAAPNPPVGATAEPPPAGGAEATPGAKRCINSAAVGNERVAAGAGAPEGVGPETSTRALRAVDPSGATVARGLGVGRRQPKSLSGRCSAQPHISGTAHVKMEDKSTTKPRMTTGVQSKTAALPATSPATTVIAVWATAVTLAMARQPVTTTVTKPAQNPRW